MKRSRLRKVRNLSGIIWLLSWFALYLEIFHWHHMTKTLHLNPPPVPPGYPKPHPGDFLIAVLTGSALAPALFLLTLVADAVALLRRRGSSTRAL